jgi:excisionase family DNA binding protein
MSPKQRLLRPEEACEFLGVTPTELRTLRSKGAIRAVKLGHRTLRYDRIDLVAFIEEMKIGAGDA